MPLSFFQKLKAIEHFKTTYNTKVKKISYKKLMYTFPIWATFISSEDCYPLTVEAEMRTGQMNPLLEILKYFFFLSHHTLPIILLSLLESLSPKKGSWFNSHLLKEREKIRSFFLSMLGKYQYRSVITVKLVIDKCTN